MLILTIRTDQPQAELGLFDGDRQLANESWLAHRQLAETIHQKILKVLQGPSLKQRKSLVLPDIQGPSLNELEELEGIVCYRGPGSFTGLRIGLSVANALAYSLDIPIVASGGNDWLEDGIERLRSGQNDRIALPKYGSPVRTTKPRK